MKIFIATPMYGGLCYGEYLLSMLKLANVFANNNIEYTYANIANESLIQRARNTIATNFLDTDATHLMFIDGDIKFDPQDIVRMIESNKEIICGTYPTKSINWECVSEAVKNGVPPNELKKFTGNFVCNLKDYDFNSPVSLSDQPYEIWNGGTGFMLIQRNVLERLKSVVKNYLNDNSKDTIGQIIYEFFPVIIEESSRRLLSEDYAFCKIARQNDIKIWLAPWVKLSHMGTYEFSGNLFFKG